MIEKSTEDTEQLQWIREWDEKAWHSRVSFEVVAPIIMKVLLSMF